MDVLVVNLEALQAVHSLVGSVGLEERNLNLAERSTAGRRTVHQLNLADGTNATVLLVPVELVEVFLSREEMR